MDSSLLFLHASWSLLLPVSPEPLACLSRHSKAREAAAITQTALPRLDPRTCLAGPSHFIKTSSVGRRLSALDSG